MKLCFFVTDEATKDARVLYPSLIFGNKASAYQSEPRSSRAGSWLGLTSEY
jgi:hypothetical protein